MKSAAYGIMLGYKCFYMLVAIIIFTLQVQFWFSVLVALLYNISFLGMYILHPSTCFTWDPLEILFFWLLQNVLKLGSSHHDDITWPKPHGAYGAFLDILLH